MIRQHSSIVSRLHIICSELESQLQASKAERYFLSGGVNNSLVLFSEIFPALDPRLGILFAPRNLQSYRQKGFSPLQMVQTVSVACRSVSTPLDPNASLRKNTIDNSSGEGTDPKRTSEFRSIVGSLMYASFATRPDISYATTALSKYSANPSSEHLGHAKHVLRYLYGKQDYRLLYPISHERNLLPLSCFTDSSYGSDLDDRKSYSAYFFQLGTATIAWCSQKQKFVAVSSTETEYMALSLASRQMIWLQRPLQDLNLKPVSFPLGDKNGSMDLVRNPRIHNRSKHIDIHFHFVRERYEEGIFEIMRVDSANNLADILTNVGEWVCSSG